MGGVELLNGLISHYRLRFKSKKYNYQLFFHLFDIAVVTGWLLYQRNCNSFQVPQSMQLDLLNFKSHVPNLLRNAGKNVNFRKKGQSFIQTQTRAEASESRSPPAKGFRTMLWEQNWSLAKSIRNKKKIQESQMHRENQHFLQQMQSPPHPQQKQ